PSRPASPASRSLIGARRGAGWRSEVCCLYRAATANPPRLSDMGVPRPPYQFSLVMGVLGGIPGTTRNLVHQAGSLPPDSHWQVIGIGLNQWPLVAAGVSLGGNGRGGLEGNFFLEGGRRGEGKGEVVVKGGSSVR